MDEDGLLEAPKSALPKPHSNPLKTQGIGGGGGYLLVVAQCGIGHHHCLLVEVAIIDFFDVCFFLRCSLPFSLHCCLFVPRLRWLNERISSRRRTLQCATNCARQSQTSAQKSG